MVAESELEGCEGVGDVDRTTVVELAVALALLLPPVLLTMLTMVVPAVPAAVPELVVLLVLLGVHPPEPVGRVKVAPFWLTTQLVTEAVLVKVNWAVAPVATRIAVKAFILKRIFEGTSYSRFEKKARPRVRL